MKIKFKYIKIPDLFPPIHDSYHDPFHFTPGDPRLEQYRNATREYVRWNAPLGPSSPPDDSSWYDGNPYRFNE